MAPGTDDLWLQRLLVALSILLAAGVWSAFVVGALA